MWKCKECGSDSFIVQTNNLLKTKYICSCCENKSSELEDIADYFDDDGWIEYDIQDIYRQEKIEEIIEDDGKVVIVGYEQ